MSLLKSTTLSFAFLVSLSALAGAAESPNLGQPMSEADLKAWDISIGPDGKGLPAGQGTIPQGEAIYAAKCQACHGEKGAGRPNDALVGGFDTLAGDKPALKTVGSYWPYPTTFFDYVRRAMPWNEPKSLTNEEVYALSAYVFSLNGLIKPDAVMNAQTLPQVQMPNRDGFITFPRTAKID